MKQFTSIDQTAKLIELGFERPKNIVEGELYSNTYFAYSIGELIKMLPKSISHPHNTSLKFYLAISFLQSKQWYVDYETCDSALYSVTESELIDALYAMILQLKEKSVI